MTAKMARENLNMVFHMSMAGRHDVAEACLKRVLAYLDKQIEKEKHIESLKEFVEEGPE